MDMRIPEALYDLGAATRLRTPLPPYQPHLFSDQLRASYEPQSRAIWSRWTPAPRPSFNPRLLGDLDAYCRFVAGCRDGICHEGQSHPVEYTILASGVPGVFNLGGDLELFVSLIEREDREGLLAYGMSCVNVLYRNYIGHGLPICTISLVQGECLGGGFEAAMSSDVVIAERHARFGFPEILFNLFPGMGAYSFLERRVGRRVTEDLLSSGRIYCADDMLALGVIDRVVDTGTGEAEVNAFISRQSRSRNGMAGIAAARRRVCGVTMDELVDVVKLWAEAACRLSRRDLRLMQRLVARQNDVGSAAVH